MGILAKLKSLLASREAIIALVSLVILVASNWYRGCEVSDLEDRNAELTNTIADRDSLRSVLEIAQGANIDIRERHARVEEDLSDALGREKDLRRYLKSKDGELLALVQTNTELRLENEQLTGHLTSDSTATFDIQNRYYQLSAKVSWGPKPLLGINRLLITDSSYVGIQETEDGYYLGFITHTNPLIRDTGATFRIAKERSDATSTSLFGYRGLWAGARFDLISLKPEVSIGVSFKMFGAQVSPYVSTLPSAGIEIRIGG
ncbi:MAG: hypothetical protein WEB33_09455 [Bacteroidota bacterium]